MLSKAKLKQRLKRRLIFFLFVVGFVFSILWLRIIEIQVFEGEQYYKKSQRVIRRVLPIAAPRGEVYDRFHTKRDRSNPVIKNDTTLNLIAIPSHFKGNELIQKTIQLEKILKLPQGSLESKINYTDRTKNKKIVLIKNLTSRQHTLLADFYLTFINFIVEQSVKRIYVQKGVLSHITGYIGPPSTNDVKRGIKKYQEVGKNGLESYYDSILRGTDGEMVQIKNAPGVIQEEKVLKNFRSGDNLILTIDSRMQKIAWDSLDNKTGAVIVLRPSNGEVLSLVSKPGYDPNILVSPDKEMRKEHLSYMTETKAELNRAISTKYPPASAFKTLVALAGLEENRVAPSQYFYCPGKFVLKSTYVGLPDTTFFCWGTHRGNKLVSAIAHSCSAYFYQFGYKLGAEPILKYARYFGLDKTSGIDLPNEITGFIPSPLWKEKTYNQRWFDGDTVNLSIGQGFVETTLIGLVNFYAALVTNGVIYRPHLVKEIRYSENDFLKELVQPQIINELPLSRENILAIKEGLKGVTSYGTARRLFYKMFVAGKTGTVQIRSDKRFDPEQHAWFIGYGPYSRAINEMIVIGVFVEKGGSGSYGAAPIAREIFRYWLSNIDKYNL